MDASAKEAEGERAAPAGPPVARLCRATVLIGRGAPPVASRLEQRVIAVTSFSDAHVWLRVYVAMLDSLGVGSVAARAACSA
jgi:hypothetical protein